VDGGIYDTFLKCKSLIGELYVIPMDIFRSQIMENQETSEFLAKTALQKKMFQETRKINGLLLQKETTKLKNTSCIYDRPISPNEKKKTRKISVDLSRIRNGREFILELDRIKKAEKEAVNSEFLSSSFDSRQNTLDPAMLAKTNMTINENIKLPKIKEKKMIIKLATSFTPKIKNTQDLINNSFLSDVKIKYTKQAGLFGSPKAGSTEKSSMRKCTKFSIHLTPLSKGH